MSWFKLCDFFFFFWSHSITLYNEAAMISKCANSRKFEKQKLSSQPSQLNFGSLPDEMYGTILSDSVNEQKIFSSRKRSRQTYRNKILRAYFAVRENHIYIYTKFHTQNVPNGVRYSRRSYFHCAQIISYYGHKKYIRAQ